MEEGMRTTDVAVIGGGPGGYVAAIRAAQLGKRVTLIEKADLGGVCLNWGCIPTKALLSSAAALHTIRSAASYGLIAQEPGFDYAAVVERSRKVAERLAKGVGLLMKKNRIDVLYGHASFMKANVLRVELNDGGEVELSAPAIIVATGARTRDFPSMRIDGDRIIGSRHALSIREVPGSVAVIGGGSIGLEFAYHFKEFGADVSVFELLPTLLPAADEEIGKELEKSFKKKKVKVFTGTRIESVTPVEGGVDVLYTRKEKSETIRVEKVLVAVGVAPNVEGLGLEAIGVEFSNGYVRIDGKCRTNVNGVYAIGDVAGPPCLAHKASAEGIIAAEHLAGLEPHAIDPMTIPACTYCSPQVSSVGMTEAQALAAGREIRVGRFPFRISGKAIAMDETEGLVKVIVDSKDKEILGCHIIGAEATEIIQEMVLARTMEIPADHVLKTIHPHPTLSEALMEAVADAMGEGINS